LTLLPTHSQVRVTIKNILMILGVDFYRFPEGAQSDLEDTGLDYSIGVTAEATMAQVRNQIALYGFSVST
jgi:hypothetical protein